MDLSTGGGAPKKKDAKRPSKKTAGVKEIKASITHEIQEKKKGEIENKRYVAPDGVYGNTIIPTTSLSVEENGGFRQIRYIKGARSIYVDEQGDIAGARITPLVLTNGNILTRDPLLQEYLDKCEHNMANGGRLYKLYDPEAEAQMFLDKETVQADAVYAANRGLKFEELQNVMRAIGTHGVAGMKENQLRQKAVQFAKGAPNKFLQMIESPLPKAVATAQKSIEKGLVVAKNNNRELAWKGGNTFLTIPTGYENDFVQLFAEHLLGEGKDVNTKLKELLGEK